MFLLDTNVVSEARRKAPAVVRWLQGADRRTLFLSVITIGEIARGVEIKRKTDEAFARRLSQWLDRLRLAYRVLPITDEIAIEWGSLSAARPLSEAAGLIAATARVHRLTLVSRDGVFTGAVELVDPWSGG